MVGWKTIYVEAPSSVGAIGNAINQTFGTTTPLAIISDRAGDGYYITILE